LTFDAFRFDPLLVLLIISLIGGMTTSLTSMPRHPTDFSRFSVFRHLIGRWQSQGAAGGEKRMEKAMEMGCEWH